MPDSLMCTVVDCAILSGADVVRAVVDGAVRGACVLGVAAGATYAMRRRSAAARHAVWSAALAAQLALPCFAHVLPSWNAPVTPPAWWSDALREGVSAAASAGSPSRADVRAAPPAARSPTALNAGRNRRLSRPSDEWSRIRGPTPPASASGAWHHVRARASWLLGVIWAAGALVLLVRLVVNHTTIARLTRAAMRVEDASWLALLRQTAARRGVRRPPTLLRGDRLAVPVTWGVWRPVVLLPASATAWPEVRRRYVLVHELAHVQRWDAATQFLAHLASAVFWFSPLVWVAAARLRLECERACDDAVLRDGVPPIAYAEDLVAFVHALRTAAPFDARAAYAALSVARASDFEQRMLAVLDPVQNRHTLTRRGTAMLAAVALVLTLPLAIVQPAAAARGAGTRPRVTAASPAGEGRRASTRARVGADGSSEVVALPPARATSAAARVPDSASAGVRGVPVVARSVVGRSDPSCDDSQSIRPPVGVDGRSRASHYTRYTVNTSDRCVVAVFAGAVRFTEDERAIVGLAPGGFAYLREHTAAADRAAQFFRDANGPLQHAYMLNGGPASDESARAWLASLLPAVLRQVPVDAPDRISTLRARGGLPAVLDHVARLQSPDAKRAYYAAMLRDDSLPAAEVEQVVQQAGREFAGSPSELRALLEEVMRRKTGLAPSTRAAMAAVAGEMPSDGDRRALAVAIADSRQPGSALLALQLARTVGAEAERAAALGEIARVGFADPGAPGPLFEAIEELRSDDAKRDVLTAVLGAPTANEAVQADAFRAARRIVGDAPKLDVLLEGARRHTLSPAARDVYLGSVATLTSAEARQRATDALRTGEG